MHLLAHVSSISCVNARAAVLVLLCICAGGWVHDVSFSHDGELLAWVGHDSSVSVANAQADMRFVLNQDDYCVCVC